MWTAPPDGFPLTLVVLAAGAAQRYGALKQLVPVGPSGEALFEYAAYDAKRAGFGRVVLVIRREHEATFRARFDEGLGRAMSLDYAFQLPPSPPEGVQPSGRAPRTKPWGTGHAVLSARPCLRGPFAVINADDFYGRHAYEAMAGRLAQFGPEGAQTRAGFRGAVMGYRVDQTLSSEGPVSRALLQQTTQGLLLDVHELPAVERQGDSIRALTLDGAPRDLASDARVSMNMWGFEHSVFDPLQAGFDRFRDELGTARPADDEFLLPGFVNQQIAAGRASIDVLPAEGPWTGMTFEADREKAQRFLAELTGQGEYPSPLWSR